MLPHIRRSVTTAIANNHELRTSTQTTTTPSRRKPVTGQTRPIPTTIKQTTEAIFGERFTSEEYISLVERDFSPPYHPREASPIKQYEAVIRVMEENGGYATLGHLNGTVLKVPGCQWRTKTPFASIRRIVQDERFFFKIKPGLWALKEWWERLPEELVPAEGRNDRKIEKYNHTYFPRLLVEIGNLKKHETHVPPQDKNRRFLERRLGDLATVETIYSFGYDNITRKVRTIDVIWFNNRKMPDSLFEVGYTTNY